MTRDDIDIVAEIIAESVKTATTPLMERIARLEAPAGAGSDTADESLDDAVSGLEDRVKALEQRPPSVEYHGVHSSGSSYRRGALVTRSGGLWLAMENTSEAPGASATHWKLVVKSGEAGR